MASIFTGLSNNRQTLPAPPAPYGIAPKNNMIIQSGGQNEYVFSSFSGSDIVATITVPILLDGAATTGLSPNTPNYGAAMSPVTIGNIQTLTVSTHRDKFPVRALKSVNPRGFTRGPRTIAGTLIFVMFDRESLREVQDKVATVMQQQSYLYAAQYGNIDLSSGVPRFLSDALPPFDITVTMANEYGVSAKMMITGVEIVDWGNVMGSDDLYVEETMTYQARGIVPLHPDSILSNPSPVVA